ncbi:hypothetical protein BIY23_02990 [Wolbachia pipientis]|uniref:Uncharacterized protein n=1 Tax=Wolbachia pipientis TaxID=955 RepID=A0A1E7QJI2_WOLPI|nr:hypothetical protein [Wolbachia pipientis]OEY86641.1 hypothetical protein BIY23_02990 [Wolbachia pipientis]
MRQENYTLQQQNTWLHKQNVALSDNNDKTAAVCCLLLLCVVHHFAMCVLYQTYVKGQALKKAEEEGAVKSLNYLIRWQGGFACSGLVFAAASFLMAGMFVNQTNIFAVFLVNIVVCCVSSLLFFRAIGKSMKK